MSDETKITIPDEFVELGKDLAKLATKYGLNAMSVTMNPGRWSKWDANIHFSWNEGRHDGDIGKFSLISEMRKSVRMDWPEIKSSIEARQALKDY